MSATCEATAAVSVLNSVLGAPAVAVNDAVTFPLLLPKLAVTARVPVTVVRNVVP